LIAAKKTIAVLPGDGVGPEVTREALKVLDAVAARTGLQFECIQGLVGGAAIDCCGEGLPEETLRICEDSDAIFLGAVGGPRWDDLPLEQRPESALLAIRRMSGCYANLRPIRLHPSLADRVPLKNNLVSQGVDIIIVRELMHGLYYGPRGRRPAQEGGEEAFDTAVYPVAAVEQVARLGFEIASRRRKHLVSMDKSNILETSRLWREVVARVASEYRDVTVRHQLIDSGAMLLMLQPSEFDVILVNNEFGDIISDEVSVLAGSLGMIPSASMGPRAPFFYEPTHGSAPDIAGRGIANPIGAILTAAMMLRYSFALENEARMIEAAVDATLAAGHRTPDIAGPSDTAISTSEMGSLIACAAT